MALPRLEFLYGFIARRLPIAAAIRRDARRQMPRAVIGCASALIRMLATRCRGAAILHGVNVYRMTAYASPAGRYRRDSRTCHAAASFMLRCRLSCRARLRWRFAVYYFCQRQPLVPRRFIARRRRSPCSRVSLFLPARRKRFMPRVMSTLTCHLACPCYHA